MIALSPEAEAQLDALIAHYEALGRIQASINLLNALNGRRREFRRRPRLGYQRRGPIRPLQRLAVAGSSKAPIGFPTA
jgi:plasmid stabilization system protein ParE